MSEVLLIGSGNLDKAAELQELLKDSRWEVKSLRDFPEVDEPEETGETFEANAALKARYYSEQFGVACVADDSGLAVDALGGAPGVYSARYAGEGCTYADNNAKLLKELADVPPERRMATFVCVAAFYGKGGAIHTERGEVTGMITGEPVGERGFGYDPLFIPDGLAKTFAQMTPEEKHGVSHRAQAFRKMRDHLEQHA